MRLFIAACLTGSVCLAALGYWKTSNRPTVTQSVTGIALKLDTAPETVLRPLPEPQVEKPASAQTAAPAVKVADGEVCGHKQIRTRWNLPLLPGWNLSDEAGDRLDRNVYLPLGKTLQDTDATLVVAALHKSARVPTLRDFTNQNLENYMSRHSGATMSSVTSIAAGTGIPLYVYRQKPDPNSQPQQAHYQSSVYVEDPPCFIELYLRTGTQEDQDELLPLFKRLVAEFRTK